ncbi:MAG TPA: LamG-like jellyroll fold domain-containing protein [Blastocatellia bacterium]|nr:LamG-like jellyroll fold domain-containing protein [Blastocatellia bacterium]
MGLHKRWLNKRTIFVITIIAATTGAMCYRSHGRIAKADGQSPQALAVFDISQGSALRILGPSSGAHMAGNGSATDFTSSNRAHALVLGDFNGDGIQDVAMGVPDATVTIPQQSGPPIVRASAGAVYIVYGGQGLPATIDTSSATGPSVVIYGANPGDLLGYSLAAGDVNGDGTQDLVIGAPGFSANNTTRVNSGAAFVVFGGSSLGHGTIDLGVANKPDVEILGIAGGDKFGTSVAVGNVGGLASTSATEQGIADILVGAPGFSFGLAKPNAGGAFLVYGGTVLNRTGGSTTVLDLASSSTPPAVEVIGGATDDNAGTSVAIASVHASGPGDIIVGSPHAARPAISGVSGLTDTGAVYVVFGGPNLTPPGPGSAIFDLQFGTMNVSIFGNGTGDETGASIAVGDVTGDNNPDIIIGAPGATGPPTAPKASCGDVFVIQGGVGLNPQIGFTARRIDLSAIVAAPTTQIPNIPLVVFGATAGDRLGSAVATGNFTISGFADSIPDLLMGAPGFAGGSGSVYVVFGGPTLTASTFRDLSLGMTDIQAVGANTGKTAPPSLRVRETLSTALTPATPQLLDLTATINATSYVETTTSDFYPGSDPVKNPIFMTNVVAGAVGGGDLELAPNPALAFNATNGVVTVPNAAVLQPASGPWTVEFWIVGRTTGVGSPEPVISSRSSKGWTVAIDHTSGTVHLIMNDGSQGFDLTSNSTVNNSLQHWAVVFDRIGSQVSFYRNGVLDVTRTILPSNMPGAINQTDPVTIGSAGGTNILNGILDDVRVYDIARGSADIAGDFASELTGPQNGLVGYWKFDAGSGTTAIDSSPSNNTGTLSGTGVSWVTTSQRFLPLGNRVSGAISVFSGLGQVNSSQISWNATLPSGTSLTVETSVDNGATYHAAVNGGEIPTLELHSGLGWAVAAGDITGTSVGDLLGAAPFAAVTANPARSQAGIVYMVPGSVPAPPPPPTKINHPPTVSITAPTGGETLLVGHEFDIAWQASDPDGDDTISKFDIALSTDSGATFNTTIVGNLPGTARTYPWTVPPGLNSTKSRVRVTVTDAGGLSASSTSGADFVIADHGISVSLISPSGGQDFKFGQTVNVSWSVSATDQPQIAGFDLLLSTDGGVTFPTKIITGADPTLPALGSGVSSFAWTVPPTCTGTGKLMVLASSKSGVHTSSTSASTFKIDDYGPSVFTKNMDFPRDSGQIHLMIGTPASGPIVMFSPDATVEVSADASGLQFSAFSRVKVKKNGNVLLTKGTLGGQSPNKFFPPGDTRVLRITNPTCGVTTIKVTREKDSLVLVSAVD